MSSPHSNQRSDLRVTANRKPGAYRWTSSGQPTQVYSVTIPEGLPPDAGDFPVRAGHRLIRVPLPSSSRPGQVLQITLPPEFATHSERLQSARLTAAEGPGFGGAMAMIDEVRRVNDLARQSGRSAQTHVVTIPPETSPGMKFTVNVNGQRFAVTCPPNGRPHQRLRIVPPPPEPVAVPAALVYEAIVPAGVRSGQSMEIIVGGGQSVTVTCPPNVVAGQPIRFELPTSQVVGRIRLAYESSKKDGWRRIIRPTDMKFQWVDRRGVVAGGDVSAVSVAGPDHDDDSNDIMKRYAYVRRIEFLEGNDARLRTGVVELVPAGEAVVDSRLTSEVNKGRALLSYADIDRLHTRPLDEKKVWFDSICAQLTHPWEQGHIQICVRRDRLLDDSVDAVMGLSREDLRKPWRLEFFGEPARDVGGPTKEWFEVVTEQLFDPACGLWVSSINNQACVDINPASGACDPTHLLWFRFTGRVIGRALFDRQLIKGHMVRFIYKHLLGWPITYEDVKAHDEEYYNNVKQVTQLEDVSQLGLPFTVNEDVMGVCVEKELAEGGAMKMLTDENLGEYLDAILKHRLFHHIRPQLSELLLGFLDVIPEPALTVV